MYMLNFVLFPYRLTREVPHSFSLSSTLGLTIRSAHTLSHIVQSSSGDGLKAQPSPPDPDHHGLKAPLK